MSVVVFLRHGLRLLVPLAVACTIYLYLYPVFGGCAFPLPSRDPGEAFEATRRLHWPFAGDEASDAHLRATLAPFRLLALGDPQLEGDTSVPTSYLGTFPHLKSIAQHLTFQTEHSSLWERLRVTLHDTVDLYFEDVPNIIESARKRLDLFANDFYLAHIYRTLHWWSRPTHVSVLGDLLGSQWIDDDEFERRGRRFWNRTFAAGDRLPDELARYPAKEYDLSGYLNGTDEDGEAWTKWILNVVGNHDVGYAGDLTQERLDRFERVFGKANYELRFELPILDPELNATVVDDDTNPDSRRLSPELRIVVLNDMNLDTPAKESVLQDATYQFINSVIQTSTAVEYDGHFTIVLTHIPLYKPAGVCVDPPFFDFHGPEEGGGVKEQFQLSGDASKGFLEGIFGMSGDTNAVANGLGRKGLILNGHDHAGCDTFHFINQTNGTSSMDRSWQVQKWQDAQINGIVGAPGVPGRREITVRSMMGDFGGNAGLLSAWFDTAAWEWRYEYVDCPLGTQHFWWLAHILDFAALLGIAVYGVTVAITAVGVDAEGHLDRGAAWVIARLRRMRREVQKDTQKKTQNSNGSVHKVSENGT